MLKINVSGGVYMSKYRKLSVASLTLALIIVSAQCGAALEDCRTCHSPGGPAGAADYSLIYARLQHHHPIGVEYPSNRGGEFIQPNGHEIDIHFFDKNLNGIADENEIQLFDTLSQTAIVDCSSCHMSHGGDIPFDPSHPEHYLRFKNTASSLCTACHIY